MEAMDLIKTRRSIRKFKPEKVSRETIEHAPHVVAVTAVKGKSGGIE